jgi:hypothetical protein
LKRSERRSSRWVTLHALSILGFIEFFFRQQIISKLPSHRLIQTILVISGHLAAPLSISLSLDLSHLASDSRDEFRIAMATLGLEMTDEEFDLVNRTYPHREGVGEVDKGIGYLEFVSMLTGSLTYVPGAGNLSVPLSLLLVLDTFTSQAKRRRSMMKYFV